MCFRLLTKWSDEPCTIEQSVYMIIFRNIIQFIVPLEFVNGETYFGRQQTNENSAFDAVGGLLTSSKGNATFVFKFSIYQNLLFINCFNWAILSFLSGVLQENYTQCLRSEREKSQINI